MSAYEHARDARLQKGLVRLLVVLALMAMARVVAASVAMERPLRLSVVMTALYFKTPQSSLVAPGFKLSQR